MARAQWIMVAGFLLASCISPSEGKPFDEMIGPVVTNECAVPVLAGIGESVTAAEHDIREDPIVMQPGWRSQIAFLLDREPIPEKLFLLVGVDADNPAMHEVEMSDVRGVGVDFVFHADCLTLTRQ